MILLQDHTRILLEKGLTNPAHAVLFSGPEGAGKAHAARYFAMHKLDKKSFDELEKHPHFRVITPENNTISIDHIRELQRFLRLQTPGQAAIRRAVIIENAHLMTSEAQNALLKALEEPPADTLLILTAPATHKLRQTIYSRVQQIPILPISKDQARAYYVDHDDTAFAKAYAISRGHAGLLHALLHDADHALLDQIRQAKQLLAGTTFVRLAAVDTLGKDKAALPLFLQACKLICASALSTAAQKCNDRQIKHWHQALSAVYDAEAALAHNPNSKLLLTDLMLHL